jgi:DNA-binding transcriptional ArsR family regulator
VIASGSVPSLTSPQLVKVFAHPIRVQAMAILNERIASPKEVAKATGESVRVVAYHFEVLTKLGCIELLRTEKAGGGATVEHFYRATRRPMIDLDAWEQLTDSEKYGAAMTIMRLISGDLSHAMQTGTFLDPDDGHLSRTVVPIDKKGWVESTVILDEAVNRLIEVKEEAAERIADGETAMDVEVAIFQFRLPKQSAA